MTNDYFKVAQQCFFFDRVDVEDIANAFGRAIEYARVVARDRRRQPDRIEDLISVWLRPLHRGPWSVVRSIGETLG